MEKQNISLAELLCFLLKSNSVLSPFDITDKIWKGNLYLLHVIGYLITLA